MKPSLSVPVAALLAALALIASGCGGDGGSSSSDPASLAPADAPVFIEGAMRPSGQVKTNVEEIASTVAGIADLGGVIAFRLESEAIDEGERFDFSDEVEPWLGKQAAVSLTDFDGEDFSGYGVMLETTDAAASQAFIDKQSEKGDEPARDGSYEGVDYKIDASDETTVGVVGSFVVIAKDERSFKDAVDASNGESLADQESYENAISTRPENSFADVYVDVGALIEGGEGQVDPQVLQGLKSAGIDPREATAVASIVPGSGQIEVDISSDTGEADAPTDNAAELLGSLPADSFAAFAVSGFGEQLQEALDQLDKTGIPGELPPGKLKSTAEEQLGFDLDKVVASFEDAGLFATGSSEANVGGALVLTTGDSHEVATAISVIGALVRQSGTPSVTALGGGVSGFSVRDREELGPQPLVVAAKGDRVAIGYGVKPTLRGLSAKSGTTLADQPAYKEAVAALGGTAITGFVDGPGALRLADSLVPSSEEGFEEAKPYLEKASYIALGSGTEGDRATAKLIVGLEK